LLRKRLFDLGKRLDIHWDGFRVALTLILSASFTLRSGKNYVMEVS